MSDDSEPDDERIARTVATLVTQYESLSEALSGRAGADDSPGQMTLMEPFEDRGEIARGGMGIIRAAWDGRLKRRVAVKTVRPSLAADPDVGSCFVEEARITAQLDHPGVVPVHALGTGPDGRACLAMKLVEGRTFRDVLRALPPPPWPPSVLDDVLEVFLKVCDAIAFAHSRGVVHRDLKPENVMVGDFGQVYVMDWGIARILSRTAVDAGAEEASPEDGSAKADAGPIGTPGYMAPEQALGNEDAIDERTDVYQLGAVLYEVLTGRPPHSEPSLFATLYHAIAGEVSPPDEAAPSRQAPPPLARIAMKALQRRRDDRYQDVLALRQDVAHFLRGEERAPTRTFSAGERVIVEGEEGAAAYVIVSGRCVAYGERDGRRVTLREMGPGDVFGETSVFTSRPRSATVEVTEQLTVKVVTRESLAESLGLHTWMGAFVRELAERFREADERVRALEHRGRQHPE